MSKKPTTPLPPGFSAVEGKENSKKKHYRCPKLGWSVSMELRRCFYHH